MSWMSSSIVAVCCCRRFTLAALLLFTASHVSASPIIVTSALEEGAQAIIYKAKETPLVAKETLVVKVEKQQNERNCSSLMDEWRCLSLIETRTRDFADERRHLVLLSPKFQNILQNIQLPGDKIGKRALVLPFFSDGDLWSFLPKAGDTTVKSTISKDSILSISRSILKGLKLLHEEARIVHGDIKPENILLRHEEKTISASITDFGFAQKLEEMCVKPSGTPGFVPPEMLDLSARGKPLPNPTAVDVFAFGSVLYMLASGAVFNTAHLIERQKQSWKKPDKFAFCLPETLNSLIASCWRRDPSQRPTIADILTMLDKYEQEPSENKNRQRFRLHLLYMGYC